MKLQRFGTLRLWLAGIYFGWSLLVYFGTLCRRGDAHNWWPIFLYPLIWPLGWLYEEANSALLDWLVPEPASVPESVFILSDRIAGGFYIVAGTIWFWLIGRVISF